MEPKKIVNVTLFIELHLRLIPQTQTAFLNAHNTVIDFVGILLKICSLL